MNKKNLWRRNYSFVLLVIDIVTYAVVLWLTDFYIGFSSFSGYEYQTVLDTIPFVSLIALPIYALIGNRANPTWLFFTLAPEIILIFWGFIYWSFPYAVPFNAQIPLLISVRNGYFRRPQISVGNTGDIQ